jgi:protein subunit release factor B
LTAKENLSFTGRTGNITLRATERLPWKGHLEQFPPVNLHGFDFLNDLALARRLAALGVRVTDCEEHFILGSGPGGQKVNKTSSTVQLLHHPTGVEVRMQQERSQTRNRLLAWTELASRLETARTAAEAARRATQELERRRLRQRSRAQKARMLQGKKHRARIKSTRRGGWDE